MQRYNTKFSRTVKNIFSHQITKKIDSFSPSSNKAKENVHLVLEGTGDSSYYYGGIYNIINSIYTE